MLEIQPEAASRKLPSPRAEPFEVAEAEVAAEAAAVEAEVVEAVVAEPEAAEATVVEPEVAEPEVVETAVVQAELVDADFDEFNEPAVAEARLFETEPIAPPAAKPEPSRADGPWKAKRKSRRKSEAAPTLPWEGRFDTSRERELHVHREVPTAPPPGAEPLALCVRHRGVLTRQRCANCSEPACDDCLVAPRRRRGKPICIECAILVSGVRKRRRNRAF